MKIDIRSLGFSYPSSEPVLDGVDLTIHDNSIHAVIGPTGCGKTTLLRLIARLEQPSSGTVRFAGSRRHANLTAMVFQTPRLLPWWTVGRNVAIGPEFADTSPGLYDHIRSFYTAHVGLGRLINRLPGTLSRGQQSRAGLGRAFAHDADVMLLDEPFTHIDVPSRRRILTEIEATWLKSPRTYVLVTHDIEEAVLLADRISVMPARPGPITETIEVEAPRPRHALPADHPDIRSAIGRAWTALERAM